MRLLLGVVFRFIITPRLPPKKHHGVSSVRPKQPPFYDDELAEFMRLSVDKQT